MSIANTSQLDVANPHFEKVGIWPRKFTGISSELAAWKEEEGRRKAVREGIGPSPSGFGTAQESLKSRGRW